MTTSEPKKGKEQYIRWCAPLFQDEPPVFLNEFRYMCTGLETCPESGNRHWQTYIELKKKITRTGLLKLFDKKHHFDPCAGNAASNKQYCSKEYGGYATLGEAVWLVDPLKCFERGHSLKPGERTDIQEISAKALAGASYSDMLFDPVVQDTVARHLNYTRDVCTYARVREGKRILLDRFQNVELRPWQQRLFDVLQGPVDVDKIYYFVDIEGGHGKSFFSQYVRTQLSVRTYGCEKKSEIAYPYDYERIVIFDVARVDRASMHDVYRSAEEFKRGTITSTKYQSVQKDFHPCHVVIFANFHPELSALSKRFWDITVLNSDD